jgi:hypothetical protein
MGNVHYLTQEKINNVKQKIKAKVDLKDIIKDHFGGTRKRLDEWLSKYSSNFNQKELDYLKYVIIVQDNVTEEEIKAFKEIKEVEKAEEEIKEVAKEEKEENSILSVPSQSQIALMSRKDRENFLLSNLVIEKLVNLLTTNTSNIKEVEKEEIKIREEVRQLQDIKVQNIRVSLEVYQKFANICKKNNLTITSVINSILFDFIEKYK